MEVAISRRCSLYSYTKFAVKNALGTYNLLFRSIFSSIVLGSYYELTRILIFLTKILLTMMLIESFCIIGS